MAILNIDIQGYVLPQEIGKIQKKLKDTVPLKMDIAKLLKSLTQETFEKQADPWGTPWVPSKRVTREIASYERYKTSLAAWERGGKKGRKPKRPKNARGAYLTGKAQTLLLTGRLRNSFEVLKQGTEVYIGSATKAKAIRGAVSNVIYFPTHQWGLKKKGIVPRPMMPIRGAGVDLPVSWAQDIEALIKEWVTRIVT
jgi:phage gpG-like protein